MVLVAVINPFFFWVLKNEPDILTNEPFYKETADSDSGIRSGTGILQIAALMNFFGNDDENEWSKLFHAKMGAYAGAWSNKWSHLGTRAIPLVSDVGGDIEGYLANLIGGVKAPAGAHPSEWSALVDSDTKTLFDHSKLFSGLLSGSLKIPKFTYGHPTYFEGGEWYFPEGGLLALSPTALDSITLDDYKAMNLFVEGVVSIAAINYTTPRFMEVMKED